MLKNALAFVAVRDISAGTRWYSKLFGREPDVRPMANLVEWRFEAGGWLQVNENEPLAGKSSVTLVETNIDERMEMLTKAGITPTSFMQSDAVSVVIVNDTDGNQIVFAQGKDENHRSTM